MPQVSITINGHNYSIACDPGEEDRIRQLARSIDSKVVGFTKDAPQAGEARLLVLGALLLADELAEAKESLRRARSGGVSAAPSAAVSEEDEAILAAGIEKLAERIETVAARLEAAHI
jgi:cell division protein ZapA